MRSMSGSPNDFCRPLSFSQMLLSFERLLENLSRSLRRYAPWFYSLTLTKLRLQNASRFFAQDDTLIFTLCVTNISEQMG